MFNRTRIGIQINYVKQNMVIETEQSVIGQNYVINYCNGGNRTTTTKPIDDYYLSNTGDLNLSTIDELITKLNNSINNVIQYRVGLALPPVVLGPPVLGSPVLPLTTSTTDEQGEMLNRLLDVNANTTTTNNTGNRVLSTAPFRFH